MSAKSRLQRSKSTRFVRTSQDSSLAAEPFDPNIARLYATAAASKAMSCSANRSSTLSEGSYDCLGGPHSLAVPPRRYRRTESSYSSGYSSTAEEPPIRHSTGPLESQDYDQPWSAALPSISEFGGLDDRLDSLPSSYRRLRKSRSMFSTRQRSSHSSYGLPSSQSYSPSIASRGPISDQPKLYRTLRRSMSFLRGDIRSQNTLRHAKSHDLAVQLARSQYEQNILNSPESPHWAPLPIPKVRREHKPFRKTFRTTSTSEKTPAPSSSIERVKVNQSHGRARTFSSSIKRSIKRVLGFSKAPSEQEKAEASLSPREQRGQAPSTMASTENENPRNDYGSFKTDHLHKSAGMDPQPTVRRMQSSRSLATSRSRVTSWADSTVANTIATPKTGGRQQLSILTEQGDLDPVDSQLFPPGSVRQGPSNAVDSHRLFSALMKRIGGANAQNSEDEDFVLGHVKEHRVAPTQGSLYFHHSRQTICQVPSNSSINSPKSFSTANVGPVTPYGQPQDYGTSNTCDGIRSMEVYEDHNNNAPDERLRKESDSPSAYSRSTNGNSHRAKANTNSPDSEAEPGVATIFASERAVYSSPSKATQSPGADGPTQVGIDWQSWMNTQVAKIESATPERHHYRENAQIQDDYEPAFTSSILARRMRVENGGINRTGNENDGLSRKVSATSNFSRPFSRSSSLRTVGRAQERSSNAPSSPIPLPMGDDVFRDSGQQECFLKSVCTGQSDLGVSPMLSRSSNQPRVVESPTPKRYATDAYPKMSAGKYGQYSTRWSPTSEDGRALHRRSARFLRENRRATNENSRLEQGLYSQPYNVQSPMSSKRMVEIFLNSRRRQMGGDLSDDGTSETAFL